MIEKIGCRKRDQHVSPQPGGPVLDLAVEPNGPAPETDAMTILAMICHSGMAVRTKKKSQVFMTISSKMQIV